jgi:hypothetical protein
MAYAELRTLNLSGSNWGDDELIGLARVLTDAKGRGLLNFFSDLVLAHNRVGDKGVLALLTACFDGGLERLNTLDLSDNAITDEVPDDDQTSPPLAPLSDTHQPWSPILLWQGVDALADAVSEGLLGAWSSVSVKQNGKVVDPRKRRAVERALKQRQADEIDGATDASKARRAAAAERRVKRVQRVMHGAAVCVQRFERGRRSRHLAQAMFASFQQLQLKSKDQAAAPAPAPAPEHEDWDSWSDVPD